MALFPPRAKKNVLKGSAPDAAQTYPKASSRLVAHRAWKRRSGPGCSVSIMRSSISTHAEEEPWSLGEASWDQDEGFLQRCIKASRYNFRNSLFLLSRSTDCKFS